MDDKTIEMHRTPVTDSQLLAIAPDGEPLRSWTEGDRTFQEIFTYIKAQSGITYGVVNVIEITPCKDQSIG